MKATINLEFTDQELTGFVERWANKVAVSAFSDMAAQIGPLMPLIRDVVMRAVVGQTAQKHASPPPPVIELDALCVAYDGILIHHPAESMLITVRSTAFERNIGFVRNGAVLKEAIRALHDRSREMMYEVTIVDATTGESLAKAKIVMPKAPTPTPYPESGG